MDKTPARADVTSVRAMAHRTELLMLSLLLLLLLLGGGASTTVR